MKRKDAFTAHINNHVQKNYLNKYLLYLYCSLGLFLCPVQTLNAEWVEFINDASVGVTYNYNVNRSAYSDDKESDTSIHPQYTFGRYLQMDDFTRMRLSADLSANLYDKFNNLNSVDVMGNVVVRHKFGVGFNKPWIRGQVSAGKKVAEVGIRDSNLYAASLSTGKRLGERTAGQLGITYNKRDGGTGKVAEPDRPSDVFDYDSVSLGLGMQYALNERSQISANLTHREGEFDSACTPENVGRVLATENNNVTAITVDDVFGGCIYKLDGTSNALRLQYNYALGQHSSFNLGYEVQKGEADVLSYDSSLWSVSYMYGQ